MASRRRCTALPTDLRRDGETADPLLADKNVSGVAGVYAFATRVSCWRVCHLMRLRCRRVKPARWRSRFKSHAVRAKSVPTCASVLLLQCLSLRRCFYAFSCAASPLLSVLETASSMVLAFPPLRQQNAGVSSTSTAKCSC